jgi:hypothetical protein
LPDLPATEGFDPMMVAGVGSEVSDPGLARRPTLVGAQIGNGVVHIDRAAHRVGVGKHIGVVPQLELFAETGGDFIAIDRDMAGGQIDYRLQADPAVVSEQQLQPAQQHRPDAFDPGDTGACGERLDVEMHIHDRPWSRPIGIKRRWQDLQGPVRRLPRRRRIQRLILDPSAVSAAIRFCTLLTILGSRVLIKIGLV